MTDTKTTVRLSNTTAHVKHISLRGGASITVPPVEGAGIDVTFDAEGERDHFTRALETPAVKKWIEDGELIVNWAGAGANKPTPSAAPPAADRHVSEPAQVTTRKTNRE
jgi:hypothetical protein